MDMFFPNIPIQQGQGNNYVSPLKHGTTPSVNDAQNAMDMKKTSMVPDEESVQYRKAERADEKEQRGKKKQKREQECQTCKKRREELESLNAVFELAREGARQGRDVVIQNLVIHYEICPECGRPYIPVNSGAPATRAASMRERLGAQYQTGMDLLPRGLSVNNKV